MKLKRALAIAGIGLSLTFALGACDTDDDNGDLDNGDVDVTTTSIVDDTATTTAP